MKTDKVKKELNPRQYKLVEWLQLAYKDKLFSDEETRKDSVAMTLAFLNDIKEIGAFSRQL